MVGLGGRLSASAAEAAVSESNPTRKREGRIIVVPCLCWSSVPENPEEVTGHSGGVQRRDNRRTI